MSGKAINYGVSTLDYIDGLNDELKALNPKAKDFAEREGLIKGELDAAQKNVELERLEVAEAAAAQRAADRAA